ncbi:unnamed protein product [Linum tenue]|uniref:Uncharacterized protein n=1 Tax=Linum tenue TaxID=586396 RepID=A0AAV0JXH2_9ROSI|nr:unnamed protein product [Linum tenue]
MRVGGRECKAPRPGLLSRQEEERQGLQRRNVQASILLPGQVLESFGAA